MKYLPLMLGIIVNFLGQLFSSLFIKYDILQLKIIAYLLYFIGTVLIGFNIGKIVGESKKKHI